MFGKCIPLKRSSEHFNLIILLTKIPHSFEVTDSDVDEANTEANITNEIDKDDFIDTE